MTDNREAGGSIEGGSWEPTTILEALALGRGPQELLMLWSRIPGITVEARNLEHGRPLIPKQKKEGTPHSQRSH